MSSLHIAVLFRDEGLTDTLLITGSDVNSYDRRLGTPLSIAVLKGYWSIAKLLHDHGADNTSEQFTAALTHSNIDELKLPDLAAILARAGESLSPNSHAVDTVRRQIRWGLEGISFGGNESAWSPSNRITTLYRRDDRLEDETGTCWDPDSIRFGEDDQEKCSILEIKDLDDEAVWYTCNLHIRGPKLCGFVSQVLEGYPGARRHPFEFILDTRTTGEMIDPNFMGLFHRADDYIRLCEEEIDLVTKSQAELLLQHLNPLWQPVRDRVEESKVTGFMDWQYLWAIYQPGQIVIIPSLAKETIRLSGAEVKGVRLTGETLDEDETNTLEIMVEVVNWNGTYTGRNPGCYPIDHYDGSREVNRLTIFPISYILDPETVQRKLVERGRKFESLRGCFLMTRKELGLEHVSVLRYYSI